VTQRWILILALGLALPTAARADCIDECDTRYNCTGVGVDFNLCDQERMECMQTECSKPRILYGAIAYGAESTAAGWAYDMGTAGDADRTALANCNKYGNDCKLVASFSNSCAAVAAIEKKGVFSVGRGSTQSEAQSNAIDACTSRNGKGCEIEAWSCARP